MNLWGIVKESINRMIGKQTIEQTFHMMPAISNKMIEAIEDWTNMYEDKASWLKEPNLNDPVKVVSLGLPAFIASEKARMAVLELNSEITAPTETEEVDNPNYFPPIADMFGNIQFSGQPKKIIQETTTGPTERAEYMNKQYQEKLLTKIRTQLEYGIAKGSLIIKPYVVKSKMYSVAGVSSEDDKNAVDKYDIEFDFIQADCFYPFSFDGSGNLTEVAFIQTKIDKDKIYTRVEHHKLEGSTVIIKNEAYVGDYNGAVPESTFIGVLGRKVPLSTVREWKDIPPVATVQNVDRMLFGYFKMPEANTIEPHSPLGISGFARAKSLIKEADLQYSRMLWEFEGGELAIDIDRDALTDVKDFQGNSHSVNPKLQARLFRPIDLGESNTYQPFSPALRDASLINGLNNILMRIEDVSALSRGTISDVAAEARTATEIKTLKQRSYQSNSEIQKALEIALRDTIYTMNIYCTLYNIVGDVVKKGDKIDVSKIGQYDVNFEWDDSIIVDIDTELTKRLTLMQNGLVSKVENRMWYFGETERQAREALDKIKDDNQQAMEENMMAAQAASQQMGGGQPNQKGNEEDQSKSAVQMPNEVPNKENAKKSNKQLEKKTQPKEQNAEEEEENK